MGNVIEKGYFKLYALKTFFANSCTETKQVFNIVTKVDFREQIPEYILHR